MNMNAVSSPPQFGWAAQIVRYHSIASLIFLAWDILVSLDDEVQYIWPKTRTAKFKWLYMVIRYGALGQQLFNQFVLGYMLNNETPPRICRAWLLYAISTTQAMSTAVEFIIITRVYVLYNKSRLIALLLFVLVAAEISMMVINSVHTVPILQSSSRCIFAKPPREIVYYSLTVLLTQSTLLALTVIKHTVSRRMGLGRTPLVSQLIRDGTVFYGIMFVLIFTTVTFSKVDKQISVVMFFWSTSVSSVSGCRLIVNMERLSKNDDMQADTIGQFTSNIELEFL
ncbi:hypothetical protein BJ138DRAFT_1155553 [Hygrophoropsis aurantiaca]|uniref:Uncharacterized protein n=1 Tax=Hygrophoropsis aurantiaca TaxID=72124 RepID=A0ACB8A761_9AGAM|nr:hypothetical protein BJ138DRAFT_1155553 [Hygrophoropsis aurantiaca]